MKGFEFQIVTLEKKITIEATRAHYYCSKLKMLQYCYVIYILYFNLGTYSLSFAF